MEYHFVVIWSEEKGWHIDWEMTIAKFQGVNVYSPNMAEWLMPVNDSETGVKEAELIDQLDEVFNQLNN